jgi:hypothetical protein
MPSTDPFRLAILGDFSARAARGLLETGEALAGRLPVKLDIDTLDPVIEGFGVTLDLELGEGGPHVQLELATLDQLHPDELYDNLHVFEELAGLRRALERGTVPPGTLEKLRAAGADVPKPKAAGGPARGTSVPGDRTISEFEALIGGGVEPRAPSPVDDLLARLVGPYIVAAPDPDAATLVSAVDQAISGTMKLILHHPEVQALESLWRSLDFLARRVETGEAAHIVVYDVSAEEMAVDLAAADDPAESAICRLLAQSGDPPSAVAALYRFEATPPHADLLSRLAVIGARLHAPILAAIEDSVVAAPLSEAHDKVREAFAALQTVEASAYLGLVAPSVLLRRPYGRKSDPVRSFGFEEFDPREGLQGMLWGNPALVPAALMAINGSPGPELELDDMPYHISTDRHGEQIALPATRRVMTETRIVAAGTWGVMPVIASRGGDRVRLGGFHSVAGGRLAGPWDATSPRRPAPSGARAGLELSYALSHRELEEMRRREETARRTGPDDIDPDLAALLRDLE